MHRHVFVMVIQLFKPLELIFYFVLHSELFGGEDQDYRPTDAKGLPLKSPSSKGWDKFKADHSEQFAYDIELKRQRSESMDVDQRYDC